jgi:hypothetical protein
MQITFEALPTEAVRALQRSGPDAYGHKPESKISDGDGVPCRHCLRNIAAGDPYLVLAYRPFPELQPYAETGPIFLHAAECERASSGPDLPEMLASPDYIVRGYGAEDRIVSGTGEGVQVHALRLPSDILSCEAQFGLPDERLTIRHDAGSSAAPYVAGTLLAVREVVKIKGLVRGLDALME